MKNKFNINDIVTFNIGSDKIRWCSILSFKISETEVRYDLLKQGQRLFDIQEYYLEEPSHDQDLTPM
jgi:hypothetical protein